MWLLKYLFVSFAKKKKKKKKKKRWKRGMLWIILEFSSPMIIIPNAGSMRTIGMDSNMQEIKYIFTG